MKVTYLTVSKVELGWITPISDLNTKLAWGNVSSSVVKFKLQLFSLLLLLGANTAISQYTITELNINSGGCPQATLTCPEYGRAMCFVYDASKVYPPIGAAYNFSLATGKIEPINPAYNSVWPPAYTAEPGYGYNCCTGLASSWDYGSVTPNITVYVGQSFTVQNISTPSQGSYLRYSWYDVTNPSNSILLQSWGDNSSFSYVYNTPGTYYIGRGAIAACQPNFSSYLCPSTQITVLPLQCAASMTANPSSCNPVTNQYSLSGTVTVTNPPSSGTLTVYIPGLGQQVINAPFANSINYNISGLPSDGNLRTVYASFSADQNCFPTKVYAAPANCAPCTSSLYALPSSCLDINNQFSISGTISVANPPSSGTMTVSVNGGNGLVFYAPFQNQTSFTLIGVGYTTPQRTVTVSFSATGGCSTSQLINSPTPISNPTISNGSRCGPGSVVLSAAGCSGGTLKWYSSQYGGTSISTGSTFITPNISSTTTYYVSCSINNCESSRSAVTATIRALPSVSAGSDASICSGQQIVITANATSGTSPYVYNWSGGLGAGSSKIVSPSMTTSYTVTVTDANSCTNTGAIIVNVSTPPTVTVNVDKSEVCSGESSVFNTVVTGGTGTTAYQWQFSDDGITFTNVNGALNAIYTDNSAATNRWYKVIVDKGSCSINSHPVKRTIIPSPSVGVNDALICNEGSATLALVNYNVANGCFDLTGFESAVDGRGSVASTNSSILSVGTLSFDSGNNGSNAFSLSRLATGSAAVDYTFSLPQQNFSNYQSLSVRIADGGGLPFEVILGDVIQGYTSLGLSANGGAGVHTFNLPTSTMLKDQVNEVKIRIQASDVGTVGTSATMRLADIRLCGSSIAWSPGGMSTPSITVAPTLTTAYTATVRYGDCQQIVNATVTVESLIAGLTNDGPLTCSKTSATLTASPTSGASYAWSAGVTPISGTNRATVSLGNATYTVTVTQISSGCTSVATTTVASNTTKPTANITATGNNCITSNAQLFGNATGGTPGYSYAYTGPNGFSSTQQNPMITQNGTYTLIVTDQNGCTDDVNIVIFNEFLPTAISASSALCTGESTVLTASGGGTYVWSSNAGGGTSNQTTVTPGATTTYTVTVTSTNGCVATATVQVVVYAKPVVTNIATVQNTSCNNTSNTGSITVTATGQSGLTMQYRINGGAWQSSNIFNNLGNGTYNVEVSYVERACYSNPASATISSQSGLTVNAENNKTVCPSTNFTLSATASGGTTPYTYGWTGGLTGSPVTVSGITTAQTYVVTVTDNKGCTATDNVVVSVHTLPIGSIAIDGQLTCSKTTSQLTASPSTGVSYLWNISSQTTRTINVTTPGTYTVTVTSTTTGCASSTSITVTQDITKPNVNAGSDKILTCTVTSIALNGSSTTSGSTFTWIASNGGNIVSGGNTATPTVNTAGTYTLTVTNPTNGCTETDVANVTLNNTPPANVTADNVGGPLTCIDNSVTISAYPDVATYTYGWSGPAGYTSSSRVNNVSIDGNYVVTVTNSVNGCTSTANTTVTKNVNVPTANAGGDRTICNGTSTT
ncbi:MAG TPA: hypothetical protein PKD16_10540, partial [Saprospiraceae bacterium]|nr:hypothetical protein [Saprospiraceae bacterium]